MLFVCLLAFANLTEHPGVAEKEAVEGVECQPCDEEKEDPDAAAAKSSLHTTSGSQSDIHTPVTRTDIAPLADTPGDWRQPTGY